MENEKRDIKELLELIKGLNIVVASLLKIKKDGIGLDDLGEVVALLKQSEVLLDAVKGITDITDEIKDLDEAETVIVVKEFYKLVAVIKGAV